LANQKLSVAIHYLRKNKPAGFLGDKEPGYGDPYLANVFWIENCQKRNELVEEYDIDLILSRFKPDYDCDFMKEIYADKDYIYEVAIK